ncbi:MAG TPA: HAD-IA family hydrolase, partial [Nitrococcus sp.]|nr:HAD-IA family hydrolase [Nitrococcus sp.]
FDLDFTLWDLTGVIDRAEERAQRFLAAKYPEVAARFGVRELSDLRQRLAAENEFLRHNVTELRKTAFRTAGEALGYRDRELATLVENAYTEFWEARHEVVLYDDAIPTLEALHGHFVIGAVTNGNADVRHLRLDHYFDFVISAIEAGAAKPSHLIFDMVRHRAGVPARQVAHIGDEPESDVIGAARNGLQAVWLNRNGVHWPAGLERVPYLECRGLQELRAALMVATAES